MHSQTHKYGGFISTLVRSLWRSSSRTYFGIAVLCTLLVVLFNTLNHKNATTAPISQPRRQELEFYWPHWNRTEYATGDLLWRLYHLQQFTSPPEMNIGTLFDRTKIPRIIHQSWKTTKLPLLVKNYVSKWVTLHSNWTYIFWTDKSSREFVDVYFHPLLQVYDAYLHSVQRADMFRYLVLYTFGGVYADIDMEPLKSLEAIRDWAPCIFPHEPDAHGKVSSSVLLSDVNNYTLISNALMACRPGHPYVFFLITQLVDRSPLLEPKLDCGLEATLPCTGPSLVSETITYYNRAVELTPQTLPTNRVMLANYTYFLPTFAPAQLGNIKRQCSSENVHLRPEGVATCQVLNNTGFRNEVQSHSFTVHRWMSSYHHEGPYKTFELDEVAPGYRIFPKFDVEQAFFQ